MECQQGFVAVAHMKKDHKKPPLPSSRAPSSSSPTTGPERCWRMILGQLYRWDNEQTRRTRGETWQKRTCGQLFCSAGKGKQHQQCWGKPFPEKKMAEPVEIVILVENPRISNANRWIMILYSAKIEGWTTLCHCISICIEQSWAFSVWEVMSWMERIKFQFVSGFMLPGWFRDYHRSFASSPCEHINQQFCFITVLFHHSGLETINQQVE